MFSNSKFWMLFVGIVLFGSWQWLTTLPKISADVPYPLSYLAKTYNAEDDASLPMVIVLHGSGANEVDLLPTLTQTSTPMRVIAFRAPAASGSGYDWAEGKGQSRQEADANYASMFAQVALSIAESTDELVARYPTRGKPYVFGFSNGARLGYYLALHHPNQFSGVFAVAGALDANLVSTHAAAKMPPVYGYHGKSDGVIAFERGKSTVDAIKALSGKVYFKEFDGGHTIPAHVVAHFSEELARLSR